MKTTLEIKNKKGYSGKLINRFNYKTKAGKICKLPSLAEPGQSTSIEELVRRANAGFPPALDSHLVWAEVEDMVPRFRDLTDISESKKFVEKITAKLEEAKSKMEKEAKVVEDNIKKENVQQNAPEAPQEPNKEDTKGVN